MKIPKQLKILGLTFKIEYVDNLTYKNDNVGEIRFRDLTILLQKSTKSYPIPKQRHEQVFFHEMTHGILEAMNNDLASDEKFVDTFSQILYQVLKDNNLLK